MSSSNLVSKLSSKDVIAFSDAGNLSASWKTMTSLDESLETELEKDIKSIYITQGKDSNVTVLADVRVAALLKNSAHR